MILLPPSEGKATGGSGAPWGPATMSVDLDDRRAKVLVALRSAMRANAAARAKLLGVKGEALAAATAADRAAATSPTMPAIERYDGVLYGALDAGGLGRVERRRLDRSVLIVSGLWGLVAPADPVPDYKLKMGASLPRLGKLSTWWRPAIDAALAERSDVARIWNLLPKEHDLAWSGAPCTPTISVRFLEPGRGGELVAVSHWNKFLKGALVRFLLERPDADVDDLADWEHPSGYVMDPTRTQRDGARVRIDLVRR